MGNYKGDRDKEEERRGGKGYKRIEKDTRILYFKSEKEKIR